MLQGHIVIGAEHNRSLKHAQTSYKPATLNDVTDMASIEDKNKHLNVSLHLGSHMPNFVSETKQMFAGSGSIKKDQQAKQIMEKGRSDHINFKDPGISNSPEMKTSMARSQFDYKGNAMEIRQ